MKILLLLIFLMSCSTTKMQSDNYVTTVWKIFDKVSNKTLKVEELSSTFGDTKEKYKHPKKKHTVAWLYRDRETHFQEWSFEISNGKKIESVLYYPNESYRHEFTIEKIMANWKNLNCIHKTRQELSPGLIKTVTYLDCDNSQRIITYNMYKEVESILVN